MLPPLPTLLYIRFSSLTKGAGGDDADMVLSLSSSFFHLSFSGPHECLRVSFNLHFDVS